MRPIDAELLTSLVEKSMMENPHKDGKIRSNHTTEHSHFLIMIQKTPEIDLAVHSRFVNMGGFPACEHCGASPGFVEAKPNNPSGFPPYCYACGAKMDLDDE